MSSNYFVAKLFSCQCLHHISGPLAQTCPVISDVRNNDDSDPMAPYATSQLILTHQHLLDPMNQQVSRLLLKCVRGCSTAIERTPCNREFVGSNPVGYWALFSSLSSK